MQQTELGFAAVEEDSRNMLQCYSDVAVTVMRRQEIQKPKLASTIYELVQTTRYYYIERHLFTVAGVYTVLYFALGTILPR